jgi:hypothetical protein
MLTVTGCATSTPVTVPAVFEPPPRSALAAAHLKADGAICALRLGDVKDERDDKNAAGGVTSRPVYLADSVAWLKSGLASLASDNRLNLVEAGGELVLDAEWMKAYVDARTGTEKSVTLVFRVRFSRGDTVLSETVVRGHVDTLNWASGDGEITGAFMRAMQDALETLDKAVVAQCASVKVH